MNGFGYVWESQLVTNKKHFLVSYERKLKDQFYQIWHDFCSNSSKLSYYCYFKPNFAAESYLSLIDLCKFRKALSTFRTSAHDLMIEKGRHLGIERNLRYCLFCNNVIECEFHFVLVCPLYKELRFKYIPQKLYLHPNLNKFFILMASTDKEIIRNLSMFIFYASKKRTVEIKLVSNHNNT